MSKITEIILGEYNRTAERFRASRPFTIYFVYAPEGNFVVKGMAPQVEEYVRKRFPICLCRYTFWQKGKSRGGWKSSQYLQLFIEKKGKRYYVSMATEEGWQADVMSFRRVPHKWLPEYNKALVQTPQKRIEQATANLLRRYS